jgi:uncharacterized membrane protein YdjX (TVP38/TMEM64 family)
MKAYAVLAAVLAGVVLGSFAVVVALELPLLTDPSVWIRNGGWVAATLGVGLLLADVVLPVPSSLVMIALGAAFGPVGGFLLALGANVGGTMIAWGLGRFGSGWMERRVAPAEQAKARHLVARYGLLAVGLSRIVPVLAETIAILAGTTRMRWPAVLLAAFAGSIPPSLIYALVGSMAESLATGLWITGGVLLLSGLAWWGGHHWLTLVPDEVPPEGPPPTP